MIPETAQKVFTGKVFEVWQWPQTMFDGSVVTFEKLKRPDTCCVLPVVGDQIVVLKQEQPGLPPFISLPGGRNDPGESSLDTAKRELKEETGYVCDDWQLWLQRVPEVKVEWTIHTFVARNCQFSEFKHEDNGEKISPYFLSFEEFLLLADDPLFRNTDVVIELLRIRLDPKREEVFRKLLFLGQ